MSDENNKKLPIMLWQYLYGEPYGLTDEGTEISDEELLEYAKYVKRLADMDEWWGFAYYGGNKRKQRSELTRYIRYMQEKVQ